MVGNFVDDDVKKRGNNGSRAGTRKVADGCSK
jgi:hypothetical protein